MAYLDAPADVREQVAQFLAAQGAYAIGVARELIRDVAISRTPTVVDISRLTSRRTA
ncbi:MAG TPA: hypothetical protein VGL61_31780 [Kofleriaceae bacterium]|jgi:hypothetical protein